MPPDPINTIYADPPQPTAEEVHARAYIPSDEAERALLLRRHHKDVPIRAELAAELDHFQRKRDAAASLLLKDPDYTWMPLWPARDRRPIAVPPTEEQTAALAEELDGQVRRWKLLRKEGATQPVDQAAYRERFQDAAHGPNPSDAMQTVYREWVDAITASETRGFELRDLEALLAIRPHRGTRLPLATVIAGELPDWDREVSWAMRRQRSPAAPVAKVRAAR